MHPDNYIPGNPLVTPASIVPEFYLLPFYAILRSIPNKLGGVIAMFGSLLILLLLPFITTSRVRSSGFRPIQRYLFWLFVSNFLLLLWLGANPVEEPYITIGQISTIFYFVYFIILIPLIGIIENILFSIGLNNNNIKNI